ncbi:hypothetical protein CLV40_13854 [Actinokineospora auranticolor]|uniref:Uncharacterized protein n=1 Tax=Actinokineospora auranticolor TaxID=155976 RepID=A0A2S6GC26_9PSEU|nr:hypothetical protein CLV40_13854 [Actinokineospora auranticolor]
MYQIGPGCEMQCEIYNWGPYGKDGENLETSPF